MDREATLAAARRRIRWRERVFGIAGAFVRGSAEEADRGAPILLYHRVVEPGSPPRDPFAVAADEFDRQIAWLVERHDIVTVRELARRIAIGDGKGMVAVTFDDGYQCTLTRALPVLRARGVPATVFVDTGRLNGPPPALRDHDLRSLHDGGLEIGSHTVMHPDLRRLTGDALQEELSKSRVRLEKLTGRAISGFAYPYGRHDRRVAQAVEEAGYAYACSCRQHRMNFPGDDPYRLTRLEINATDGPRRFEAKLAGRYAPLYSALYRMSPGQREFLDS